MDRSQDWMRQAEFDFNTAKTLQSNNNYPWTCFISHQTAEKALKALLEKKNMPSWGHDLTDLLRSIQEMIVVPQEITNACARLNLYYIPTRYPDAYSSGAPADKFTNQQATDAIKDAKEVLNYVRLKLTNSS
jgi:HEPN domain-containing protein